MYIGIDFDGTLADHCYPEIGKPVPGAVEGCKELVRRGAKLILFTMRSDSEASGPVLTDAVEWCKSQGIELFGVNRNPTQDAWTNSPKAYAHVYVDDAAFGCPLKENPRSGGRPFVDWSKVMPTLIEMLESA
jgi:hypothetical protein